MIRKLFCTAIALLLIFSGFSIVPALATDEYIEIYDDIDLAAITRNPDGNYKLMADIDMAQRQWYPIAFNGILDGNNYTIYNLRLNNISKKSYTTLDWHYNEYNTHFAALFSKCENAVIKNLNLVNVTADITTDEHCFVAGIVGISIDTQIINCHVQGRLHLTSSNKMIGIGGLVGFGQGYVGHSTSRLIAVLIDNNPSNNSEEFIGGIWAIGYPTIENCDVILKSYATTFGYTHDGGIIGMHRIYDKGLAGYRNITDCTVDVALHYFEHSNHGHRHYGAIAGERLNKYLEILGNTIIKYEVNKYYNYNAILLPCMCENGQYIKDITLHTCTDWGYNTYTCPECDYTYTDYYTPPAHTTGEWETVAQSTYLDNGLMVQKCSVCDEPLGEQSIPKLVYVKSCDITPSSLELAYKSTASLSAAVSPEDAENASVIWSSSDVNVATIDKQGNVYALARGTTTITCASADGNAQSNCNVTVHYTFKQWLIVIFLFGWIWY